MLQGNSDAIAQLVQQEGDATLLEDLCDNLVAFDPNFNIIEP